MIYPRCKQDQNQVYISADGLVVPCCWVGSVPHLTAYKKFHAAHLQQLNVIHRPLDEILVDERFLQIERSWTTEQPFAPCKNFCGQVRVAPEGVEVKGNNLRRRVKLQGR